MEVMEVQTSTPSPLGVLDIFNKSGDVRVDERGRSVQVNQDSKEPQKTQPDKSEVESIAVAIAESVNNIMKALNTHLSFKVSEDTGEMVVQVIDSDTGEVRRQIPPEEVLALTKKMKTIAGLLFDVKA